MIPSCFGKREPIVPRATRCRFRSTPQARPDAPDLRKQAPDIRGEPDLLRQAPRFSAPPVDPRWMLRQPPNGGREPRPPGPASAGLESGREGTRRPLCRSERRPPRWKRDSTHTESGPAGFGRRGFLTGLGRRGRYPWGFRGLRFPATVASVILRPRGSPATRSSGVSPLHFIFGRGARETGKDGRKRQGGNDRSDAERLLTRGTLRRVRALRETGGSIPSPRADGPGTGKRNEPQSR
jgi:hypothetical protein